jgi:environmental stress-induced protein Ves
VGTHAGDAPKTTIPVNTRKSAHFREIIGDIVRISIGKRAAKKSTFFSVFAKKDRIIMVLIR